MRLSLNWNPIGDCCLAQSLETGKSLELAQEELAKAGAFGVAIVSLDDPAYPTHLKEIYDPPLLLCVRRAANVLAQPDIAAVGTRHPTPYGSGMAERLAIDLSARSLIISGMSMGCWWSRLPNIAEPESLRAGAESPGLRCSRQRTNQNSWGPNTVIKQGAKLVATWEDVWEEPPENVRLALAPAKVDESPDGQTASLLPSDDNPLSPHERKILALLKADEATPIDEIVERLEPDLSSSEIFAALFELELAGKVKQLLGKNFVESF